MVLRRTSLGWTGEDGELLPADARNRLTRLLVELANLQTDQEGQRPEGELARQLTLSIAARVTERNATVLRWWPSSEGSVVSEGASGQTYVSSLDLDSIFAEILGTP